MRGCTYDRAYRSVQDRTVPYPTASFSPSDPFADHEETGLVVDADADNVILRWRPGHSQEVSSTAQGAEDVAAVADDVMASSSGWIASIRGKPSRRAKKSKRKPSWKLPALPPAFQYRFPFNYVSESAVVLTLAHPLVCADHAADSHRLDVSYITPLLTAALLASCSTLPDRKLPSERLTAGVNVYSTSPECPALALLPHDLLSRPHTASLSIRFALRSAVSSATSSHLWSPSPKALTIHSASARPTPVERTHL